MTINRDYQQSYYVLKAQQDIEQAARRVATRIRRTASTEDQDIRRFIHDELEASPTMETHDMRLAIIQLATRDQQVTAYANAAIDMYDDWELAVEYLAYEVFGLLLRDSAEVQSAIESVRASAPPAPGPAS